MTQDGSQPTGAQLIWDTMVRRRQIESSARTAAELRTVALPDLEVLSIPVPDLPEQQVTVRRADELNELGERLVSHASQRAGAASTASILGKAFRGELAPQAPKDEPASVLLARIRAAQEQRVPTNSPRRRSTSR